jgi:hypothetical protein
MKMRLLLFLTVGILTVSRPSLMTPHTYSAPAPDPEARLASPKSNGRLDCARGSDGIYRCSVSGDSKNVVGQNFQLLLWVNAVQPSGDGWYLQRGGLNGIRNVEKDGKWSALAQVGSLQYPPHEKDLVEIGVTIVSTDEARTLLKEAGVIVRGDPVGTIGDKVKSVSIHLR